ncbi:hypothetical protein OHA40_24285 [Nocardia sp. NBC_00508]|uniref:hypothetical protein n=1 Tax=Nocardia sp. NBC_00508 TaxID=2975992 RepID=UPI002E7FF8DC|nr:hypothetical protein [Nocardia sp. NBC_00508]WUD64780.1 hypothetical protein OHA40_24285 [Nocardia sp. NBC_00508]
MMLGIRGVLTVVTTATAAAVITAPAASAYITAVTPTPGLSLGANSYGTGCTYTVTITGDPGDKVVWVEDQVYRNGTWDHVATGTFGPVREVAGKPGQFTVEWTPNATGEHYLGAGHNQYREGASVKVNVGTGSNLGSSCVALP